MNRQILFFDIDGTLVDSTTHIVPASTRAALQKLKKAGHGGGPGSQHCLVELGG